MGLRVTFLGNDPWSVPSLDALAASAHDLVSVVTREPRPAGRGKKLRQTPVAEAARAAGLPLEEVATVKEGPGGDALARSAPDVLAVVAYGEILPPHVLGLPRLMPVNVHFSLLPALRGANPVRRAIAEGHPVTGVTTMRMDEGMDTGPMLLRHEEPIDDDDDAGTLGGRLAAAGGRLLVETIDRLERGDLDEIPQDHGAATIAKRFSADEEWLDWSGAADALARRIRALAPEPGARTRFRGATLKVLRARPADGRGAAGEIIAAEPLTVAAGEGAMVLEEVLPEGKRRMSGEEFARGRRPDAGERLG